MIIKFKSKIELEIVIPISLILGGASFLMIIQSAWAGLIIIMITTVFILHLFLTTDYTIKDDVLIIRSSFIIKKVIGIRDIKKNNRD